MPTKVRARRGVRALIVPLLLALAAFSASAILPHADNASVSTTTTASGAASRHTEDRLSNLLGSFDASVAYADDGCDSVQPPPGLECPETPTPTPTATPTGQ